MIALILSFFLLLISTTSNIKENVWEFGVLRAMGLTKSQSKRVYMYEAFAVIFGALILGIMVGLVVSITLTAQFYLFIELPFKLSVRLKIVSSYYLYSSQQCSL
jgi:ABC-type antimicrobial peptide transport system permease subunit